MTEADRSWLMDDGLNEPFYAGARPTIPGGAGCQAEIRGCDAADPWPRRYLSNTPDPFGRRRVVGDSEIIGVGYPK